MCNISISSSIMENEVGQGRSRKNYKSSMIVILISIIGIAVSLILSIALK